MKKGKTLLIIVFLIISVIDIQAWPWPDTGQKKCYNDTVEIACPAAGQSFFGQDAQYSIQPRSYTKLGENGVPLSDSATPGSGWIMTRDNVTGLVWENKTDDNGIHDKDKTFTWCDTNPDTNGGNQGTCGTGTGNLATDTEAFVKALNDAKFGGFSDWRMPTIKELSSLVDSASYPGPTIDPVYFSDIKQLIYTVADLIYWSANTFAGWMWTIPDSDHTDYAWFVKFDYGPILGIETKKLWRGKKSSPSYVRAVRAGERESSDHLVDNGDETVTDTDTGLMWKKSTTSNIYTWRQALEYAENLTLAGYGDWRLPNRNEMQSLVDYSEYYPAIDPLLKPFMIWVDYYYFWTSTTYGDIPDRGAWVVGFDDGDVDVEPKYKTRYVRPVRAGQSRISGHLFISSPGQADRWIAGEKKDITWDTAGIPGKVRISLSREGGKEGTYRTIVESTENDGIHSWRIGGPASVNCVLKIEPIDDPSKATSQGLFSISGNYSPGLPCLMLLLAD